MTIYNIINKMTNNINKMSITRSAQNLPEDIQYLITSFLRYDDDYDVHIEELTHVVKRMRLNKFFKKSKQTIYRNVLKPFNYEDIYNYFIRSNLYNSINRVTRIYNGKKSMTKSQFEISMWCDTNDKYESKVFDVVLHAEEWNKAQKYISIYTDCTLNFKTSKMLDYIYEEYKKKYYLNKWYVKKYKVTSN